jgi:hypothetical protein
MKCSIDNSRTRSKGASSPRANASVLHFPSAKNKCSARIKAALNLKQSLGNFRANVPPPASLPTQMFGASPSNSAPENDGKIKGVGKIRFPAITKYQEERSIDSPYQQVINQAGLVYLKDNPDTHTIEIKGLEFNPLVPKARIKPSGKIRAALGVVEIGLSSNLKSSSVFKTPDVLQKLNINSNKFINTRFSPAQKLFPIADVSTEGFVDRRLVSSGLYENIDDGILIGDYGHNLGDTTYVADDHTTYIQANSIEGSGNYNLKFKVSTPLITARHSYVAIRAAAPLKTRETDVTPTYTIKNIKFIDPSGNNIAEYKDIFVKGDADYTKDRPVNYTTYVTEPKYNYAQLNTWHENFPVFQEPSGSTYYSLSMDIEARITGNPFDSIFSRDFKNKPSIDTIRHSGDDYLALQGSPVSTQYQNYEINPNNTLRISAIEVLCSGNSSAASGYIYADRLPFFVEVAATGRRVERQIFPTQVLAHNTTYQVSPQIESVWQSSPTIIGTSGTNETTSGNALVTNVLTNRTTAGYIKLETEPSGKLSLKFEHKTPLIFLDQRGGSFAFGGRRSGLSKSELKTVEGFDSTFQVDDVFLKVTAKKYDSTVPDFGIDVVGWSDDELGAITPSQKGFLQNKDSNISGVPLASGFVGRTPMGISTVPISVKDQYKEYSLYNDGGDHVVLSNQAIINNTDDFEEYIVPLKIYPEIATLGKDRNFKDSRFFEHLYMDIYPLPSGAMIRRVELVVKHKPSNTIHMYSLGKDPVTADVANKQYRMLPSLNTPLDKPLNIFNSGQSLSAVSGIPHAFKSPSTLKTNYSRRWIGTEGSYNTSSFKPKEFDFSFSAEQPVYPFSLGFYNFNSTQGDVIHSNAAGYSGVFSASLSGSLTKNLGLRFNNTSLFPHSTDYTTIDWTQAGDDLHGKIYDAFENVVRTSGSDGYIYIEEPSGNLLESGFAVFANISPDISISGADYNLFNSGIVFSKYDSGKDLQFVLGYSGGYLYAEAQDSSNNIIRINDNTSYTDYQYPLPILLTYNDNNSNKLKLYTDKQITPSGFNRLRASSSPFVLHSGDSKITFGYSEGSGVGYNGFFAGLGISSYVNSGVNLVESNPSAALLQSTVDSFFEGQHVPIFPNDDYTFGDTYRLFNYINNFTTAWHLGGFKYCEFGADFDVMTNRDGINFISHRFISEGETYASRTTETLPTGIVDPSGLSYHTQIENDMLRLSLSDNDGRLYNPGIRISKEFPRGYMFNEDAITVETVMQHEVDSTVTWPDGSIGPRLTVSLYTTSKEPRSYDGGNIGLINRSIHYIGEKECWFKLTSKFDRDSVFDTTSEPWSNFKMEEVRKEFGYKYNSNDINKMFVQFDLAYPSGTFDSNIKIHTVNVVLNDALCRPKELTNILNFYASGDKTPEARMPLVVPSVDTINSGDMQLFASGYIAPVSSGDMQLYQSGAYIVNNGPSGLSLNSNGYQSLSAGGGGFGSFGSYGSTPTWGSLPAHNLGTPLFVLGRNNFSEHNVGLYAQALAIPKSTDTLVLFTKPTHYKDSFNISLNTNGGPVAPLPNEVSSGTIQLFAKTDPPPTSFLTSGSMNFFAQSDRLSEGGKTFTFISNSESGLPLVSQNFSDVLSLQSGFESFAITATNQTSAIDISDNSYASIPLTDNIRGVQTVCFGDCDSGTGCTEAVLNTHDTDWTSATCVTGGVARALSTYTNASDGYTNAYYAIRKFSGLIPNSPYNITISAMTGTSGILEGPREVFEWEYGSNEDVDFSGVKIVPSDSYRASGNKFGKGLAIKKDLAVVGAPGQNLDDNLSYTVQDAGQLFVYKRNLEPSGFDWSSQPDKSSWTLDSTISLPEEFRRDYYEERSFNFNYNGVDYPYTKKFWSLGQDGREMGYSVDLARLPDRDIIVAGCPGAKFSRTLADVSYDDFDACIIVFTDEFTDINILPGSTKPTPPVKTLIEGDTEIFRYFANPAVRFNTKIIVIEPVIGLDAPPSPEIRQVDNGAVFKFQIDRHFNFDKTSQEYIDKNPLVFSGIKQAFLDVFPYDATKANNNIPSIVGIHVDGSQSLGFKPIQNALDDFIDFYRDYSEASGLLDASSNPASGHVVVQSSPSEDWLGQTLALSADMFDASTLQSANAMSLFSNNFGTFNSSLAAFNVPPNSGGCVMVFERASGESDWTIIQQINSNSDSNELPADRFGHDVAISKDGSTLVIGSPYNNQGVQIYRDRDENEFKRGRLSRFSAYLSDQRQYNIPHINTLDQISEEGASFLGGLTAISNTLIKQLDSLNASGQYKLITDNFDTTLNDKYILSTEFATSNILFHESFENWRWFARQIIPNSRLGYSVDTNDDGSIVVAGAPTDSLGANDSLNTYYLPKFPDTSGNWKDNVNAGSVRVLEARKYFPHDKKVVEYGRFGNKHRSFATSSNQVFYDAFDNTYKNKGYTFERLPFSETEIPSDAGLLFINTPELDAASDEIINNIKEWLAQGDRHLVLVGDDPSYEVQADGTKNAFRQSNIIINKILDNLNSRMRLHSARKIEESLSNSGVSTSGINIVPSFVPEGTVSARARVKNMRASGVADIRLHYPNPYRPFETYNCANKGYRDLNDFCALPMQHNGDLRTEWEVLTRVNWSSNALANQVVKVEEPITMNLATYFYSNSQGRDAWAASAGGSEDTFAPTYQYEPRPLLAAAIQQPDSVTVIPATPPTSSVLTSFKTRVLGTELSSYKRLADIDPNAPLEVLLSDTQSGIYSLWEPNVLNDTSQGKFFNPSEYNGKDGVLQGKAETSERFITEPLEVEDAHYLFVQERVPSTNSDAFLICQNFFEQTEFILEGADNKLNVYGNVVKFNDDYTRIAQIGGFTGRSSFRDAFSSSRLMTNFKTLGHEVTENITPRVLSRSTDTYNVAWIANPIDFATDEEIADLKSWLASGDRKIVITYGGNTDNVNNKVTNSFRIEQTDDFTSYIKAANIAADLCSKLGLTMEPIYLSGKGRHDIHWNGAVSDELKELGWRSDYRIEEVTIPPSTYNNNTFPLSSDGDSFRLNIALLPLRGMPFIPIKRNSGTGLIFADGNIYDDPVIVGTEEDLKFKTGLAQLSFPAVPGSGYSLFFNYASESIDELHELYVYVENVDSVDFQEEEFNVGSTTFYKYDSDDRIVDLTTKNYGAVARLSNFDTTGRIRTVQLDMHVPAEQTSVSGINIYIDGTALRVAPDDNSTRTVRLISVSGVAREIEDVVITEPVTERYQVFNTIVSEGSPSREVVKLGKIEAIQNGSNQYCNYPSCLELEYIPPRRDNSQLLLLALQNAGIELEEESISSRKYHFTDTPIQDGPVVAAQEVYQQGTFDAGFEKSRITVLGDASMIQGPIAFSDNVTNAPVVDFLLSLYPLTNFNNANAGFQYENVYKIVSPERASPQKLVNYTGNSGIIINFAGSGGLPTGYSDRSLSDFSTSNQKINPLWKPVMLDPGESYRPDFKRLRELPLKYEEKLQKRQDEIDFFILKQLEYNAYCKFSGVFNGTVYEDASLDGGVPKLLQDTGYDHIDIEHLRQNTAYPGDLFGYSVLIDDDKIYVGSPFSAFTSETILPWEQAVAGTAASSVISGVELGYGGGAGSVYIFNKSSTNNTEFFTPNPWGVDRKIRPETINVGVSGQIGDMFGASLAKDGDILAIGAPGHSYDNVFQRHHNSGEFQNKSFNKQFDLSENLNVDLGSSGNRALYSGSGVVASGAGAVFAYENKISDWSSKRQQWTFTQKLLAQGYGARLEDDHYGISMDIDRTRRNDGDYTLLVGSIYNPSGTDSSFTGHNSAGAMYTYDAMLRSSRPSVAHPDTFIAGRIVGNSGASYTPATFNFSNSGLFDTRLIKYATVQSNESGEIFIEASGEDKIDKGFVVHRPYLESIEGSYSFGARVTGVLDLFMAGKMKETSGNMPLFAKYPDTFDVYNNMNLNTYGISGVANSGFNLVTSGIVSSFTGVNSGIDLFAQTASVYASSIFNLSTRGRR